MFKNKQKESKSNRLLRAINKANQEKSAQIIDSLSKRDIRRNFFYELNNLPTCLRNEIITSVKQLLKANSAVPKAISIDKDDIQNPQVLANAIAYLDKKYKTKLIELFDFYSEDQAWIFLFLALELLENEPHYNTSRTSLDFVGNSAILIAALQGDLSQNVTSLFFADQEDLFSNRLTTQGVQWCEFIMTHPTVNSQVKLFHYKKWFQHAVEFNNHPKVISCLKDYLPKALVLANECNDHAMIAFCHSITIITSTTVEKLTESISSFANYIVQNKNSEKDSDCLIDYSLLQPHFKLESFHWDRIAIMNCLKYSAQIIKYNQKQLIHMDWLNPLVMHLVEHSDCTSCLSLDETNELKSYLKKKGHALLAIKVDLLCNEAPMTPMSYLNLMVSLSVTIQQGTTLSSQLFSIFLHRLDEFEKKISPIDLEPFKNQIARFLETINNQYLVPKIEGKNPEDCLNLGNTYLKIGKNEIAFALFMRAAELKNLDAMYQVALSYFKGIGVNPDLQKANEWICRLNKITQLKSINPMKYKQLSQDISAQFEQLQLALKKTLKPKINLENLLEDDPETLPEQYWRQKFHEEKKPEKKHQDNQLSKPAKVDHQKPVNASAKKPGGNPIKVDQSPQVRLKHPNHSLAKNKKGENPVINTPIKKQNTPNKNNQAMSVQSKAQPQKERIDSIQVQPINQSSSNPPVITLMKRESKITPPLIQAQPDIQLPTRTWADIIKGEQKTQTVSKLVESERTFNDTIHDATVKCLENFMTFLRANLGRDERYLLATINLLASLPKEYCLKHPLKITQFYQSLIQFCTDTEQFTAINQIHQIAKEKGLINATFYEWLIDALFKLRLPDQAENVYFEAESENLITPSTSKLYNQIKVYFPDHVTNSMNRVRSNDSQDNLVEELALLIANPKTRQDLLEAIHLLDQITPDYIVSHKDKMRQLYCNLMKQCALCYQFIALDKLFNNAYQLRLANAIFFEKSIEAALVYKLSAQAISYYDLAIINGCSSLKLQHLYIRALFWGPQRHKAYEAFDKLSMPAIQQGDVNLSGFNTTTVCMFMDRFYDQIASLEKPLRIILSPTGAQTLEESYAESKVIQANLIAYFKNHQRTSNIEIPVPEVIVLEYELSIMDKQDQRLLHPYIRDLFRINLKDKAFRAFNQLKLPQIIDGQVDLSGFNSTTICMYIQVFANDISKLKKPIKILYTPLCSSQIIDLSEGEELIESFIHQYNEANHANLSIPQIVVQNTIDSAPNNNILSSNRNQFFVRSNHEIVSADTPNPNMNNSTR